MENKFKSYLIMHIAVFLFGFTAILGKLISISEAGIVWFRLLFTCISLLFFPQVWRSFKRNSWITKLKIVGIGILVCLHWICFYGSIKYANVSVALSCMATASFFVSFIEPLFFKKKLNFYEVILGFLVVPGIYLIFYFSQIYITGIILGLLAALLAATFSVLNKLFIVKQDAVSLTFFELGGGWVFLSLCLPLYFNFFPHHKFFPDGLDWLYLFILAIFCTTVAYILSILALKNLSAFAVSLTVNLEPIYGIFMAIIIFNENKEMNSGFFVGSTMIITSIFLNPLIEKYQSKKRKKIIP